MRRALRLFAAILAALLPAAPVRAVAEPPCAAPGSAPFRLIILEPSPPPPFWPDLARVLGRGIERGLGAVRQSALRLEAIGQELRQAAAAPGGPAPLLVLCDYPAYDALMGDAGTRAAMARLGLEVVNAPFLGTPFPVFIREAALRRWPPRAGSTVRLAFFASAETPGAQIANDVAAVLPRGLSIEVERWHNPATLAQQLRADVEGGFDLVALLDEEPSSNLALFLREYRRLALCAPGAEVAPPFESGECRRARERYCAGDPGEKALERTLRTQCLEPAAGGSARRPAWQPRLLPLELASDALPPAYQLPSAASGLRGVLAEHRQDGLHPYQPTAARQGVLSLVRDDLLRNEQLRSASPLLLTNIRTALAPPCADRFPGIFSDAFLAVLPLVEQSVRAAAAASPATRTSLEAHYRSFLASAYLLDPGNLLRGLVLYGHLSAGGQQRRAETLLEAVGLERSLTPEELIARLRFTADRDLRRMFSRSSAHPYDSALKEICRAIARTGERREALQRARAYLLACLFIDREPKRVVAGTGLWSIPQYDPYWQLTRLDLLERLDVDPGPACP